MVEVDESEHIVNDSPPPTASPPSPALSDGGGEVPGFDREELWNYGVIMYQVSSRWCW